MEEIRGKTLKEWKDYCKNDNVPINTMKYITCLEERIEALILPVVSKCDCDNHIACIVCGEEKGLDGDFWKRMKETPKIEDWLKDNFKRLDRHSFTNTHEDTVWLRSELVEVYNQLHP